MKIFATSIIAAVGAAIAAPASATIVIDWGEAQNTTGVYADDTAELGTFLAGTDYGFGPTVQGDNFGGSSGSTSNFLNGATLPEGEEDYATLLDRGFLNFPILQVQTAAGFQAGVIVREFANPEPFTPNPAVPFAVGTTYAVQFWLTDLVSYGENDITTVFLDPNDLDNSVQLRGVGSGLGQYVVGTFEGDGVTTELNLFAKRNYDPNAEILPQPNDVTALAVGLVPEPSSLALLGLGGLLIARRRRA